jgi:uncharacterized protein with PQ loop repeat
VDDFKKILRKLVSNPLLDLAVGFILFIAGIMEVWETLPQDLRSGNIKSAHGVTIFGFVMALKAFTDIFAGLAFVDEANKVEKEKIEKLVN